MCYNCNEKGHISANCPKKNKESRYAAVKSEPEVNLSMATANTIIEEKNSEYWIGDSRATRHMKNTLEGMSELIDHKSVIYVGNGEGLKSKIMGTFHGTVVQKNGTRQDIMLNDVAYVPELTTNLFSITTSLKRGCKLTNKDEVMILNNGSIIIKFDNNQEYGSGFSPGVKIVPTINCEQANVATTRTIKYHEAHQKLGHPGENTTRATALKLG